MQAVFGGHTLISTYTLETFYPHSFHALIPIKFNLLAKGVHFFIVRAKSANIQNSIVLPIFPLIDIIGLETYFTWGWGIDLSIK